MADAARQSCVAAMLALSQLGQPPDTSHRRNKDLPQRSSTVTEPADTNAGCAHVQPPCINPDVIQPPPQQARALEHTHTGTRRTHAPRTRLEATHTLLDSGYDSGSNDTVSETVRYTEWKQTRADCPDTTSARCLQMVQS